MTKPMPKTTNPLVSVIIPVYNAQQYLAETVDCILNQTYKDIEVIIVNDCSTDNSLEVMRELEVNNNNISVLNLEKNVGPYHGRIIGADVAKGKYISFVDSDDQMTADYFRSLVSIAENNTSDIVVATTVVNDTYLQEKYIYNLASDLPFDHLEGNEGIEAFLGQRGHNYMWHVVNNKLFSAEVWKKARPHYDEISKHLIMCDDVALSLPLWYFADRVDRSTTDHYFYRIAHDDSATALNDLTPEKAQKNITDLSIAFNFCENFLKKQKIYKDHETELITWRKIYSRIWKQNIADSGMSDDEKTRCNTWVDEFAEYDEDDPSLITHFYDIRTPWNDGLEKIKESIINPSTRVVSFDIFDTLIVRPLYKADDLFKLLEKEFKKISTDHAILTFHDIRTRSEYETRLKYAHAEDITLTQIYETISELYGITRKVADAMMQAEIDYELKYCFARNTGLNLYKLAQYLNKTVVLTSDMYLSRDTIETLLANAGYSNWDKFYLSSEVELSKASGGIYPYITKDLSVKPSEILHIGDNHTSDVKNALKAKLQAVHFPAPVSLLYTNGSASKMFESIVGNVTNFVGQEYLGIATFMAVVANKYFDNPFTSFNQESAFNASPSMLGYYGLGMHMFGTADWLLSSSVKNGYDNLVFCARDGYLPMKAYDILARNISSDRPKTHYLPTSRKSLLALSFFEKDDLNHLDKFVNLDNKKIKDVFEYLKNVLDNEKFDTLLKENKLTLETKCKTINYFLFTDILKNALDLTKLEQLHAAFSIKFNDMFAGKVAVYDIGYSAKPEAILSKQFSKPIDVYFTHTSPEGAYRTQTDPNLSLSNFYNFSPFITGGLRELVISEQAPSCIQYALDSNGLLETVYEENFSIDYYEQYVIETMQKYALQFIDDVTKIFADHIDSLVFTNQYISLPLEAIISTPSKTDSMVFKPVKFEDDMGIGRVDDITGIISFQSNLQDLLGGKSKIEKALAYVLLDRHRLIEILKTKTNDKTQQNKFVNNSLKNSYKVLRKVARKLTK